MEKKQPKAKPAVDLLANLRLVEVGTGCRSVEPEAPLRESPEVLVRLVLEGELHVLSQEIGIVQTMVT